MEAPKAETDRRDSGGEAREHGELGRPLRWSVASSWLRLARVRSTEGVDDVGVTGSAVPET